MGFPIITLDYYPFSDFINVIRAGLYAFIFGAYANEAKIKLALRTKKFIIHNLFYT